MSNLFMSYDYSGLEEAKKLSEPCPAEFIDFLLSWGTFDLERGHCASFQIYNENGEIVYNSETKVAA